MVQSQPTEFVSAFQQLGTPAQKDVVKELARTNPGLFDFDKTTRRLVWVGLFTVLLSVVIGAFILINNSFGVDITTTTGSGQNQVTATTHPDVSAAWAAVAAVITGIIGVFVPSPSRGPSNSAG